MAMNFYAAGDGARRKEEILRIVRESTVHSQDEILSALKKRGFKVTQPTLSRDLRDLGLAKTPSEIVAPLDVASAVLLLVARSRERPRIASRPPRISSTHSRSPAIAQKGLGQPLPIRQRRLHAQKRSRFCRSPT